MPILISSPIILLVQKIETRDFSDSLPEGTSLIYTTHAVSYSSILKTTCHLRQSNGEEFVYLLEEYSGMYPIRIYIIIY